MDWPTDDQGIIRQIVFPNEGWPTFTNDPLDKGGPTKGGITLPALQAFLGKPVTVDQLQALPEDTAIALYTRDYIEAPGFDLIVDLRLRTAAVDMAVLFGQTRAENAVIQAAIALEHLHNLPWNGKIDANDAASINAIEPRAAVNALSAWRIDHHDRVVAANPSQLKYLCGWNARALRFIQ